MQSNPGLTKLQNLLAYLYPEIDLSKQIVEQAEVPTGPIEFTSAATTNWHNILKEAQRHKRVNAIVVVAQKDYPERAEELAQAEQAFRHWLEQPEPPENRIPDTRMPTGAAKYNTQITGAAGVVSGDGAAVVQHLSGSGQASTPAASPSASTIPSSVVRDLLLAAFTADDLRRLFAYTSDPDLGAVTNELSPGDGLAAMVDKVILYCQKRDVLPALLDEVKEANPRQYAHFRSRLQGQSATRIPAGGIQVSEQREMLEQELAQHQRNLTRLRAKKAVYAAGEEPLSLLNQIDAEVREIERVEAELRALA